MQGPYNEAQYAVRKLGEELTCNAVSKAIPRTRVVLSKRHQKVGHHRSALVLAGGEATFVDLLQPQQLAAVRKSML